MLATQGPSAAWQPMHACTIVDFRLTHPPSPTCAYSAGSSCSPSPSNIGTHLIPATCGCALRFVLLHQSVPASAHNHLEFVEASLSAARQTVLFSPLPLQLQGMLTCNMTALSGTTSCTSGSYPVDPAASPTHKGQINQDFERIRCKCLQGRKEQRVKNRSYKGLVVDDHKLRLAQPATSSKVMWLEFRWPLRQCWSGTHPATHMP